LVVPVTVVRAVSVIVIAVPVATPVVASVTRTETDVPGATIPECVPFTVVGIVVPSGATNASDAIEPAVVPAAVMVYASEILLVFVNVNVRTVCALSA
jgi:hypothetical protein